MTALQSNGEIRFDPALGASSEMRTLVFTVSGGPSGVNAWLASGGAGTGVSVMGSGSSRLAITGTAADINAYLTTTGIRFNGPASATAYDLKATVQRLGSDGVVRSAATASTAVTSVQVVNSASPVTVAAPTLSLPAVLTVLPANGEIRLSNAVGAGSDPLTVGGGVSIG